MAQQVFPSNVVANIVLKEFFPHRKLRLAPRGLARDAELPVFNADRIIGDIEQFDYLRFDALRETPRGARDWVVVLILGADGKFHHSPDLRKLLESIESERPAKEGRLDEIIVVAEDSFFSKKNLTDVVRDMQQKQAGGPDFDGAASFYSAYPYYNFAFVVPAHESVPPHRIMCADEVDTLLRRERIVRSDLSAILTTDAAIVWNGGRDGQVVEITRDSQTAGVALSYRRIERGAI